MQIKPFTMSIVVGSAACQARCEFCVSKQTVSNGVEAKFEPINYKNWHQAMTLAKQSGVTTILLTGKGEPTLFPDQITEILIKLVKFDFPIIELQTNAIKIDELANKDYLNKWFRLGLRTIAISNVGIDDELNRQTYLPYKDKYINLEETVKKLHNFGFSVRMATVMIKNGIETVEKFTEMVNWCKNNKVEQFSLRPVSSISEKQTNKEGLKVISWIDKNRVDTKEISDYLTDYGNVLLELPHGAIVYDLYGQNVCLTNCLTHSENPDTIRQLIYFPDGSVRYSWVYEGARIL